VVGVSFRRFDGVSQFWITIACALDEDVTFFHMCILDMFEDTNLS